MTQPPAVVFVHGLRTSHAIWSDQQRLLMELGYPSIAIDLPGHGVRRQRAFTLAGARAVLDDALASLTPGRPVLLAGLSLGGYTVLDYAARRPGAAVGVLACACSSDPAGKPLRAFRNLTSGIDRLRNGPRTEPPAPGADRPDAAFRPRWQVVAQALTELSGTSSLANLRAIDAPVWLVNGRWDHLRWESGRYLRARPGVTEHIIKGAAHDVNTDAPGAFNDILLSILAELESVPALRDEVAVATV